MSTVLQALRDKPLGYFKMDDATPFDDYSGYGAAGSMQAGTAGTSIGLGNGFGYSTVFSNGNTGQFTTPVFASGWENKDFSLEATVRSIQKTEGVVAQTYKENLASNTAMTSTSLHGIHTAMTQSLLTNVIGGYGALRGTRTTTGATAHYLDKNQPIVVVPGQTYYMAVFARSSVATSGTFRAGKNATTTVEASTNISLVANTWQRLSLSFTAASDTTSISADVVISNTGTIGDTLDVTLLVVTKDPIAGYFDGNYPGWEFSGAANLSPSRTKTRVSRVNLNLNPQPVSYTTATNYATWRNSRWFGNGTGTYTIVSGPAPFGNSFARKTWTAAATTNSDTGFDTVATGFSALLTAPGETLTLTAYLRPSTVKTAQVSIYQYTDAGVAHSTPRVSGGNMVMTANQWNKLTYTYTVPAGVYFVILDPDLVNGTGPFWQIGDTLDGANMIIERNTSGNYFDATFAGAEWVSTPNASSSLMIVSDNEQQILGNNGQYDGLTINGTVVSFVTKYTATGEARASYDMQNMQRAHVVGVHTSGKNALYVNGELVATQEITDVQKADTFAGAGANLYSGATTSSKSLAINGIGMYASALNAAQVLLHYNELNRNGGNAGPISGFDGTRINLSVNESDLFLNEKWETTADWTSGTYYGITIDNQKLTPQVTNDVSIAGTWLAAVPLGTLGDTSVYGVNMWWDGVNAIVEASLDGVSWTTVTKGQNISIIAPGYNPTGKILSVRVRFTGGYVDDPAFLDNLHIYGYRTGNASIIDNRTIGVTSPGYMKLDGNPIELNDAFGTELRGGTLTIGAETGTNPVLPKTIEVWMKALDSTGPTLSSNITTGSTVYTNGAAANTAPLGEWVLKHYTLSGGFTGALTFTGNVQIGQVALYDSVLSATQVKAVYDSYLGVRPTRFDDASSISATETPTATNIYAHDWSITGAG